MAGPMLWPMAQSGLGAQKRVSLGSLFEEGAQGGGEVFGEGGLEGEVASVGVDEAEEFGVEGVARDEVGLRGAGAVEDVAEYG